MSPVHKKTCDDVRFIRFILFKTQMWKISRLSIFTIIEIHDDGNPQSRKLWNITLNIQLGLK